MRLSRQFTKQKQENEQKEKQRIAQGKKVQGVLHGLQDLNISMALTQLKSVAGPEIIRQVSSLRTRSKTTRWQRTLRSPLATRTSP